MEPTFAVLTDVAEKMVIPLVEEGSKNKTSGQQSRFDHGEGRGGIAGLRSVIRPPEEDSCHRILISDAGQDVLQIPPTQYCIFPWEKNHPL